MIGICKLTRTRGKFVKAHIIPEAFSRRASANYPMTQSGQGTRPKRRWTSWYDPQLVTAAGERILADYDDWAIRELRRTRLVSSGWGPMTVLSVPDYDTVPGTTWGIRKVQIDGKRLRLFYLSVLWRAAMCELSEFNEIKL